MQTLTTLVLIAALAAVPAPAAAQPLPGHAEAAALRQLAAAIPPGTRVDIRTRDGRRLSATLLLVEPDRIVVKRRSRVPEPAIGIVFDDIVRLERHASGDFGLLKVVGVGLAAGVGAILTVVAVALTLED